MKVFISWSGEMSKELGETLRNWIPAVIQQVKPYFTPSDIEKGARWSTDIADELNHSSVGIICLTKENLDKPWIMFEAGALSKQLESSSVCPILFGIENSDLQGPLVQFQATLFKKSEIRKLMLTINNSLGDNRLEDSILDSVFDMWWPKLEEETKEIIAKYESVGGKSEKIRGQQEILEEILALTRMTAKREKFQTKWSDKNLDPEAFIHLGNKYVELFNTSKGTGAEYPVMEAVRDMSSVVSHLIRLGGKTSNDFEETMENLRSITELK